MLQCIFFINNMCVACVSICVVHVGVMHADKKKSRFCRLKECLQMSSLYWHTAVQGPRQNCLPVMAGAASSVAVWPHSWRVCHQIKFSFSCTLEICCPTGRGSLIEPTVLHAVNLRRVAVGLICSKLPQGQPPTPSVDSALSSTVLLLALQWCSSADS